MKILFKNITQYNEEMYTEFLEFHQKNFRLRYLLYTTFIIGLLLFSVALQIKNHNIDFAILTCFIITIFFLWRYLHPFFEVSKEFNSEKIQNEKQFIFSFFEKTIKVRENKQLESYIINYKKLYKVFETDNYFYLYIDSNHAFLINKNSFFIGTPEDFSNFIRKKCKIKYSNHKINKSESTID